MVSFESGTGQPVPIPCNVIKNGYLIELRGKQDALFEIKQRVINVRTYAQQTMDYYQPEGNVHPCNEQAETVRDIANNWCTQSFGAFNTILTDAVQTLENLVCSVATQTEIDYAISVVQSRIDALNLLLHNYDQEAGTHEISLSRLNQSCPIPSNLGV